MRELPSIRRRAFLGSAAMAAALLAGSRGVLAAVPPRPNIVLILLDDFGIGDARAYNPLSAVPTPNIDRLAREGMRFTDMHASSAVCTPSRYSILTGRYCWRSRLKKGVLDGTGTNLIDPGRLTLPGLLQKAGYHTSGIGKWHLGLGEGEATDYSRPLRPGPNDHGFDYYFGIPSSLDYPPYLFFENDHVVEAPSAHTDGSKEPRGVFWRAGQIAPGFRMEQTVPTLTDKAVEVITSGATRRKADGRPFFLYFPLPSPHTPWVPLPEYQGKSGAGTYGDYAMETDAMVGRVLAEIDRQGIAEDTVVIFTSDNGADWKIEDAARFAHRANGPWRGEKADAWEAGHRIPFIVRWPGKVKPGSLSPATASLTDIMATVAGALALALPDDAAEDSFDLDAVLSGDRRAPVRPNIVDHSVDGIFTIREGNWKLIMGLGSGGFSAPRTVEPAPGGPLGQLYDLRADPREENNLYQQHPEIVARLTATLEKLQREGRSRPRSA
ncbi:arylsulfatase A-like enzyme [Novosphingobium sp. PhB165]|uniref:sulfatase-like hydrolase/transferase n=1 Tax=Novosphingobium sp. PhB165 TaxID=2485105 RepID=UPI0010E2FFD4|nr:sulfatase-like hydrolase/transferase [Novosphingobium sp. PhB165]TCM14183.1 arylsulfatase A-like enzyme [Novosphingobium sp. PhB165]